jgi:hypothetical protein
VRLFIPVRVPWPLLTALAVVVSLTELAVGLGSLAFPGEAWLNVLVLALTCAFVVVSALGYVFHRGRSCRCFGALSQRKFDLAGILRSAVIAGVAAFALMHVGASALLLDATERVLLLAVAGLLAVVAFTAARARGAGREPDGTGSEPEPRMVMQ